MAESSERRGDLVNRVASLLSLTRRTFGSADPSEERLPRIPHPAFGG